MTTLQVGIIATANYAFLNYLVLSLGVLLLDDAVFARLGLPVPGPAEVAPSRAGRVRQRVEQGVIGFALYATVAAFLGGVLPGFLSAPARLLAPFRVANAYGLFATMTPARYEIEFQGTLDGQRWVAYPFRYKPQDPEEAPGIYAPYQPRFEWNLWFASLEPADASPWVVQAQARLLERSPSVLHLFRRDPFRGQAPRPGAHRALAVLVHRPGDEAADRRLVATPSAGGVRATGAPRRGRRPRRRGPRPVAILTG